MMAEKIMMADVMWSVADIQLHSMYNPSWHKIALCMKTKIQTAWIAMNQNSTPETWKTDQMIKLLRYVATSRGKNEEMRMQQYDMTARRPPEQQQQPRLNETGLEF